MSGRSSRFKSRLGARRSSVCAPLRKTKGSGRAGERTLRNVHGQVRRHCCRRGIERRRRRGASYRKRLAQRLAYRGGAGFPARGDGAAAVHRQRRAPLALRRRDTGVRLGLRQHRRRRHIGRAQLARAARAPGRRDVDGQRNDRGARRAVRFRSLGCDGKQRMGVEGPAALVHRDRKRRQFWRRPNSWARWADRHPALSAAELGACQPRHV